MNRNEKALKTDILPKPTSITSSSELVSTLKKTKSASVKPTDSLVAADATAEVTPSGVSGANEFRSVIEETLLPCFQRSVDGMFSQVQREFESGIATVIARSNEYHQRQLELYLKESKAQHEAALQQQQLHVQLELAKLRKEMNSTNDAHAAQVLIVL